MTERQALLYAEHLQLYLNGTHGKYTTEVVEELLEILREIADGS